MTACACPECPRHGRRRYTRMTTELLDQARELRLLNRSFREIAQTLGVSERSLTNHRSHIEGTQQ